MKVIALLSGGKDSVYNLVECVGMGHEIICVANLYPPKTQDGANEIDSSMYQSVGVEIVPFIAQCLGVPIVQCEIKGKSVNQDLYYQKAEESKEEDTDEVEDLFNLLTEVKTQFPDAQAVASGAIGSNYQRLRVENCCQRLGLVSLAYLWERNQSELLDEMIKSKMHVQIVKICSMGLKHEHLGMTIADLREYFHHLRDKFDFHVCGEGGEYESAVFDCPLFKTHKLVAKNQQVVSHDDNQECPVAYLAYSDMEVVEKSEEEKQESQQIMEALIQSRKNVSHQYLLNTPSLQVDPLDESKLTYQAESLVLNKVQLSVSIINPALTTEQIQAMDQKTQLLMIFDHLKTLNIMPFIVKVALLVTDLSQFKPLNAEYVKQFGLRPPVRVCVQVPSDEVIFIATVWNNKGKLDDDTIAKFKYLQNNMHVQSVSHWAPPNVGPYSQINKMDNVLFMAGQISLYPPALALVDPNLIIQYQQVKKNYTSCLLKISEGIVKDTSVFSWQHYCKAATIFVPANVDVVNSGLLEVLKADFAFMSSNLVLVRVNALPLGSSIEIEMNCDTVRIESDKLDKLWKNHPYQRFFANFEAYENAPLDGPNVTGEVYYNKDMVTREQIATQRSKKVAEDAQQSNILGVTAMIPALEIIDVFSGQPMAICERYQLFV